MDIDASLMWAQKELGGIWRIAQSASCRPRMRNLTALVSGIYAWWNCDATDWDRKRRSVRRMTKIGNISIELIAKVVRAAAEAQSASAEWRKVLLESKYGWL